MAGEKRTVSARVFRGLILVPNANNRAIGDKRTFEQRGLELGRRYLCSGSAGSAAAAGSAKPARVSGSTESATHGTL